MGEIYRLASRVVAWLGPEEDNSNRGMELMDYLGSQVVTSFGGSYGLRPALGTTDASLSDSEMALPFDATELEAIYHLICRDWFDRLWVRQEISLANVDGVVVCGSREVAWHRFRTALAALFRKKHKLFPLSSQLESQIDRIRGFIFQPPNVRLSQLRHYFEYAECGDPRDRIYGVLSLLPRDAGALGIQPDYTKTAIQIYEDATLRHLNNGYRLDILFQCELPGNGVPAGPSWVPDWSSKSRNVWDWDKMSASSKLVDWFSHNSNNRTLTLAGIVSEVIDDVQPIQFQLGMGTKDVFKAIHAMLPRGIRLDSQYVGGGSLLEAYTRTLMCGMLADNYEPQPPRGVIPTFDQAADIVTQLAAEGFEYKEADYDYDISRKFTRFTRNYLLGKHLFRGRDGHIGIAPPSARSGDHVCILVGSNAPLIFRPTGAGRHLLVGPCYMWGAMQGECLLGPLPGNTRMVSVAHGDSYGPTFLCSRGFRNRQVGKTYFLDDRLMSLPRLNLGDFDRYRRQLQENPWSDFILDPEILRRPGVNIEYFILE
jgi:hypothetical protein